MQRRALITGVGGQDGSQQQPEPDDHLIATGVSHTVDNLITCAFDHAGLDWRDHHVRVDESLRRARPSSTISSATGAGLAKRLSWSAAGRFRATRAPARRR